MGSGDDNAEQDNNDDGYTAPDPSPVAQTMIDALTYGPTGYSDDVMRNLGMDVANPGYQGGPRPTSGMTQDPVMGYQPRAVTPDPLKPALARGPATPATVNDLYPKYAGGTVATQVGGDESDPSPSWEWQRRQRWERQ